MNSLQREFIEKATAEASRANHPFPVMAACEAALESNYGLSALAREDFNLFGIKQHAHPVYGTANLPTREFENGEWTRVLASWVVYPDWCSCFADRMATLERLSNAYPHYKAALAATDPELYVTEVSKTWSTDPERGKKVISIYRDYSHISDAEGSD